VKFFVHEFVFMISVVLTFFNNWFYY